MIKKIINLKKCTLCIYMVLKKHFQIKFQISVFQYVRKIVYIIKSKEFRNFLLNKVNKAHHSPKSIFRASSK